MSEPRGVEARLQWMAQNEPGEAGRCAEWAWKACGGDQSPPSPPAWGAADANAVVKKARSAGVLFTGRDAPRGSYVVYESSSHGHAALSKGDGDILGTDPYNDWGTTGTTPLEWPEQAWGCKYAGWIQRYAGTLLPMADPGPVYVDRLFLGSKDSDSVRRLQDTLNHTSLPAPGNIDLPVTGTFGEQTEMVLGVWQTENGHPQGPITNAQADDLFRGSGHTVVHTDAPAPEPPDPEPEPPEPSSVTGYGSEDWYSGKKTGPVTIKPGAGWTDLPGLSQPPSGITEGNPHDHHFAYFRAELTSESTAKRLFEVRWVRSDGDATAYDHRLFDPSVKRSYGFGTYHTERGSGLGGKWQAKVTGGSDPVQVTTHYAKTEIEWQDVQEQAAAVAQQVTGLPVPALRAVALLTLFLAAVGAALGAAGVMT